MSAARPMTILGVSALYHDSAAAVLQDGRIVAAAQEERFSRVKGDARIPHHAIAYVLAEAGVKKGEIDRVVFMDKPLTKLTRLMSTYGAVAPRGLKSFLMAMPAWLKEKGQAPYLIERYLKRLGMGLPRDFQITEHHQAHAASAFYPSPFEEAAIITCDGVGEWTTTAIGVGEGSRMRLLYEQRFPHSLGMLYSAFTYFCGFKVNSGEYKLMGLAPYGEPRFVDVIKEHLISIREDGSFRLDLRYFDYLAGLTMTNERFAGLFGGPARTPDQKVTEREMDLARSIQVVTEEIMLKMARYARAVTGKRHLCMAGGVALNCVANGHIHRAGIFGEPVHPARKGTPAAPGRGAFYSWHHTDGQPRVVDGVHDGQAGSLLEPRLQPSTSRAFLDATACPTASPAPSATPSSPGVADGWKWVTSSGRMEYGLARPRQPLHHRGRPQHEDRS
ncbi:MAG: carbamoyltransferase N-terminal domain-containing protein [bacterium]